MPKKPKFSSLFSHISGIPRYIPIPKAALINVYLWTTGRILDFFLWVHSQGI